MVGRCFFMEAMIVLPAVGVKKIFGYLISGDLTYETF